MKKVLFVATVVKKHINVFHLPYLKKFKEWGWETSVCAKNDFENGEECVIPHCDKYYDIPFERFPLKLANIKSYNLIKRLIKEKQYDIIHCHTPTGGMIARLAAKFSGSKKTKVIYTAHGFHFFKGAPLKNWLFYFPVEWLCSFFTDVLITINGEDYNFAKKHMHAKKVEYVPGVGIDTKKINSIEIDRDKKREELGIPKDNIAVLSVGEISHRKNHEAVINALAKLNNPKIHYYIVGTGILKEKLINLVAKLQLEEYVHFMGYRTDIYELCKACDIFCFPSLQEGLPVALMEAMSAGMPVVCSKIRGSVDLLDSKGGRMCLPKDVNSLAENIEVLANNEKLRWQMGKYNKKAVINFDIKNVQTFMQKIYERV